MYIHKSDLYVIISHHELVWIGIFCEFTDTVDLR